MMLHVNHLLLTVKKNGLAFSFLSLFPFVPAGKLFDNKCMNVLMLK